MLGCTESYIRKIINRMRSEGIPICSKQFGYYFSCKSEDINNTISFLTHRVHTQIKAIEGLLKASKEIKQ